MEAPAKPLFADRNYAWALDGKRIVGRRAARTSVRSTSTCSAARNLDAGGGRDQRRLRGLRRPGRSIVFANADATGTLVRRNTFHAAGGGIYSVEPPAALRRCSPGTGAYDDVAALWRGAVGFTPSGARTKRTRAFRWWPGPPAHHADTRGDAPVRGGSVRPSPTSVSADTGR